MKFTDGYWLLREGVTAAHPVEPIRHRGDLLRGPVVTISAHTPMPDVIGGRPHAHLQRPQGHGHRAGRVDAAGTPPDRT